MLKTMLRIKRNRHRISLLVLVVIIAVYIVRQISITSPKTGERGREPSDSYARKAIVDLQIAGRGQTTPNKKCLPMKPAETNISTVDIYSKFEFQPSWIPGKEFWNQDFERRYNDGKPTWSKLPLEIILMPHSHNDPGWLKTFEDYYYQQSSKILSNIVEKLHVHSNMTFIWTEVSILAFWYERAHPRDRAKLKSLVQSGRLEITSGGWVMPDEASPDVYALVTQMIEGHQWVFNNLGIKPKNGWTVDTFGHGAAVPYLLKEAGIDATVLQRLHYMWKQWMAHTKSGDFYWRQNWDSSGDSDILTHNSPYDIYSIKHSCGPHPHICLNFDFEKNANEYTEHAMKATDINEANVKEKSELFIEQLGRTGSLFPHNVVLMPLGNDFRYERAKEFDQQYVNYQRMAEWVNSHPAYNARMRWGTLKDYFEVVRKRSTSLPTLKGDFFVYSDIFSSGRPAYWSGYYSTRPYFKWMSRRLESVLAAAEFTYTWAWATHSNNKMARITRVIEKDYEKLSKARRSLSLFQHHDAITGTSRAKVMHDYAIKLHQGIQDSLSVLGHSALVLLANDHVLYQLKSENSNFDSLQPSFEQPSYERLPLPVPISFDSPLRLVVLTNVLGQRRKEVVSLVVTTLNIRVTQEHGRELPIQFKVILDNNTKEFSVNRLKYEMTFIADLPPLSVVTYTVHKIKRDVPERYLSTTFSNLDYFVQNSNKQNHPFEFRNIPPGDVQLENEIVKVVFDGANGLLRSVTDKRTSKVTQFMMKYGAYTSAQSQSGAYIFKPEPGEQEYEDVLKGAKIRMFIHSGPLYTELMVLYGFAIVHSFQIFHVDDEPLGSGIYMENLFNFGSSYDSEETPGFAMDYQSTELFFRFQTDINNGKNAEYYTDQSGLGMMKRTLVESIGIEGNYYPISRAVYLEDGVGVRGRRRVTLLTDRAAGVAAWKTGYLESMIERRMYYDDGRGLGEGVTDQKTTQGRYWILLENVESTEAVPRLSLAAHHLSNVLNNPVLPLVLENLESDALKAAAYFFTRPLPCPIHPLTTRVLSQPNSDDSPSQRALFVFQHLTPSCVVSSSVSSCRGFGDDFDPKSNLTFPFREITETSLTGLYEKTRLNGFSDLKVPQNKLRSIVVSF